MIKPAKNGLFQLWTSDGSRPLGPPTTYDKAKAQEDAINIDKAREAGHRIPEKVKR